MDYDIMDSDLGRILLSRDHNGINGVHFLDGPNPPRIAAHWQRAPKDPLLQETVRQLEEYFARKRRKFSIPLSFVGTEFQVQVWKGLTAIAYGDTWSYKQLARFIERPSACRAVGNANSKNKISIIVP